MKTIIISLIAVACIGLYGAENKQNKDQNSDKKIAVLESKVFKLENENKKLKSELERKNKAISALAMRLVNQPERKRAQGTNRNSSYDPAAAAKIAAEQQKKQRARQLAITEQKIKYYENQKIELAKEYKEKQREYKSAQYIIGKKRRQETIQQIENDLKVIQYKMSKLDSSIKTLQMSKFDYK